MPRVYIKDDYPTSIARGEVIRLTGRIRGTAQNGYTSCRARWVINGESGSWSNTHGPNYTTRLSPAISSDKAGRITVELQYQYLYLGFWKGGGSDTAYINVSDTALPPHIRDWLERYAGHLIAIVVVAISALIGYIVAGMLGCIVALGISAIGGAFVWYLSQDHVIFDPPSWLEWLLSEIKYESAEHYGLMLGVGVMTVALAGAGAYGVKLMRKYGPTVTTQATQLATDQYRIQRDQGAQTHAALIRGYDKWEPDDVIRGGRVVSDITGDAATMYTGVPMNQSKPALPNTEVE